MTREEAHKLVDDLYDAAERADKLPEIEAAVEAIAPEVPVRELPEGKRVVRSNTSGDRVYLLDEVKKTRAWITNPEVLDSLGFTMDDVGEVDENEMLKYQMAPAMYKRVDG